MQVLVSFKGHHPARNFELFDRYESRIPAQYLASERYVQVNQPMSFGFVRFPE